MILIFADWKLSPQRGASLGHQYDNLTSELIVQGDLPEGWEWDVLVNAGGNGDTWHLTPGDGQASIALTEDNLSVEGEYYLQLRGIKGELVRHTNIVTAHNFRSLSGAGQWPTLPTEWIQAEKDIKELNAHPPVPGEDGYWQLWDLSTHSYQPSQLVVPGLSVQAGTVTTLEPDAPATVKVVGDGPDYKFNFGIPQGKPGTDGAPGKDGAPGRDGTDGAPGKDGQTPTISVGSVATLDPGQEATAEITGQTPDLTLNLGIPQGQPGQDGVQINDEAVSSTEAWSSKKIVDTLCPPFTETGNPITCNPVEDYPLDVTVTMEPIQEGTGDPSPDNVRPITGRDSVQVTRCGKNLVPVLSPQTLTITGVTWTITENTVSAVGETGDAFSATSSSLFDIIIDLYPSKTYTFSWENTDPNIQIIAAVRNPDGDTVRYLERNPTYTVPGYGYTLRLYAQVPSNTTVNGTISKIQLELGSTPTPYEPYQGSTTTITLPETIYGGEVDAVSGVGSGTNGILQLEYALNSITGLPQFDLEQTKMYYMGGFGSSMKNDGFLCSHYPTINNIYVDKESVFPNSDGGMVYIRVSKTYANTLDDFKSFLSSQYAAGTPVTVCYKLATPEPFQATGNQPILALAGENTVYTDGDTLTVSGRTDPTQELQSIQTMKAQLATMLGSAEEVS